MAALDDPNRAKVVFECCTRLGVVNELPIDYEMKRNLERLLDEHDERS